MAIPVFVIGQSGSGKTYSIKNFSKDEVGVISVEKGRLPFKSDIKVCRVKRDFPTKDYAALNVARYAWIQTVIATSKCKAIVIDDSQYLLVNELFERAKEKSYEKFTDMAVNFRNLIHFINDLPEDDKIVYFLHHTDTGADGREKAKTIGKMLDEKLTLEGCFDIVLYCQDHKFFTQANGQSTAKTPEGLFDTVEIPNDLKLVDSAIRDYYELSEQDETAKA